jgi:GNAT superfamily N-acetyltransferase
MLRIREAQIHDAGLLRTMIRELAEFERQLDEVTIREEDLARDGFGEKPWFHALIAEWVHEPAGYALFYGCYSTWIGRGMYLEDIFVREAYRGRGIGRKLVSEVARIAVAEGCAGLHWAVLGWNEKAIRMYKAMGAEFRDEWEFVLLTGEALQKMAEEQS